MKSVFKIQVLSFQKELQYIKLEGNNKKPISN